MKILLIGNQINTIVLFRKRIIEKLLHKKMEVFTLTMDSNDEKFKLIKSLGAHPLTYKFSRSGMNPFSDFINTIYLAQKIKKINPDVVFCFFPKPVVFGSLAAKLAGVKNINLLLEGLGYCFTRHPEDDCLKKKIVKKIQLTLYKYTLPLAKKVLFLNKDDYRDLIVAHNIKIKDSSIVGGIGVDLNEYNYNAPDTSSIHFTMVSRLLVDKGVREYIEAASIVKETYPDIHFSIAGSFDDNPGGIQRNEYEEWIQKGDVEFKGQIDNIKDYLIGGSVFVLPSYREGVPRSTQEAMAIGRAIITTDVPGCRETIVDGYNGFLIPPWDAQELANKMILFIKNPEIITTMGLASRQMAEQKFDQENICDDLIKNLLS